MAKRTLSSLTDSTLSSEINSDRFHTVSETSPNSIDEFLDLSFDDPRIGDYTYLYLVYVLHELLRRFTSSEHEYAQNNIQSLFAWLDRFSILSKAITDIGSALHFDQSLQIHRLSCLFDSTEEELKVIEPKLSDLEQKDHKTSELGRHYLLLNSILSSINDIGNFPNDIYDFLK